MLYPKTNSYREVLTLDGFWHFCKDEESKGLAEGWYKGIPKGREMAVPASINEQSSDLMDYFGLCWFEKDVYLPKSFKANKVYLRFGSVTGKCTVWVNAQQAVCHEGGSLPFECEISENLHDGENTIVVLSDNRLDPWSLPPAAMVNNEGREGFFVTYPAVTYDFFPYSGIHRSVYLYTCAKNRIEDITIKTRLDAEDAILDYEIQLSQETQGEVLIQVEGYTAVETIPPKSNSVKGCMRIANPRIWDMEDPHMYAMRVVLKEEGQETDEYVQSFGI